MNSAQLFSAMPATLAAEIVEFAFNTDKKLFHTAMEAVAQARKLRLIFLERLPRTERFALMASALGRPGLALVANSLISTWLIKQQAPLLAAFLDSLKIKHENGVVEDLPKTVEDTDLQNAVDALLAKFPHPVVAIYLNAFNEMNEARWSNLELHLETDPRLQLKRAEPGATPAA
jgi:hypothetical protein